MSYHSKTADFPLQQLKSAMKNIMTNRQNLGKIFLVAEDIQIQSKVKIPSMHYMDKTLT